MKRWTSYSECLFCRFNPILTLKRRLSRPWVQPNPGFIDQLDLFHKAVHRSPIPAHHLPLCRASARGLKLDFAERFIAAVLSGKKTATMRSVLDVDRDANSTLADIHTYSFVFATSVGVCSNPFALIFVHAIDSMVYASISPEVAKPQGMSPHDLQTTLREIYPDITSKSQLWQYHFTCVYHL